MGYGFVTFKTSAAADSALKTLQHKRLDGHCVELKRSTRAAVKGSNEEEVKTARKKGKSATEQVNHHVTQKNCYVLTKQMFLQGDSTKLVVRNVPFEATAAEVEEVFKTFGALKSVRLPKKVAGSHRGFAFVDFQTKGEAAKAFEALSHSTHLYGRRLVLEWAEEVRVELSV